MSQPTNGTVATDLPSAPSVDEAIAALTESRTKPGASPRRLGWRRDRSPSGTPTIAAPPAPAVPRAAGVDEAEAAAAAPTAGAPAAAPAGGDPLHDAAAIEALGPYIARLMVDARQAAADYRRDTEREASERAAQIFAAAVADGDAIRARAVQQADAILDAARIQAQSLAARVTEMAAELRAGADTLAQPATDVVAAPAPTPSAVDAVVMPAPVVDASAAPTTQEPAPVIDAAPLPDLVGTTASVNAINGSAPLADTDTLA